MDFLQPILQSINLNDAALLGVVCSCLCVILIVVGFVLQFVGGTLEAVFGLFGFVFDIIQAGPLAWCGCLVLLLICGGCCAITFGASSLFATCGTPEQINLCRFIGY